MELGIAFASKTASGLWIVGRVAAYPLMDIYSNFVLEISPTQYGDN